MHKELIYLVVMFIRNRMFIFLGFALVFSSFSYLLKPSLSKIYLPFLQESPRDPLVEYFERIPLLYKDMGELTSTPSYYGNQTGYQVSPK